MFRASVAGLIAGALVAAEMPRAALAQWNQEAKLLAADGAAYDRFGVSVALSADRIVVGAYLDDDNGTDSGSAYVFRWDGSQWVQEQKLLAADGAPGDLFGVSVALFGDRIVVGAQLDDDNGYNSGSAYMFRWDGSQWVQEAKLLPTDGAAYDEFGLSVAVSGDRIVVGAIYDDDNGTNSGSAYVFRWDGSQWVQEQKLLAADGAAGDFFGRSVALFGDRIVVGAQLDDDNGTDSGSAYMFRWDGSQWVQEAKLLPTDGAAVDEFGVSVALSGDRIVVGAYGDDDNGPNSGSAYVFYLSANPCPGDLDADKDVDLDDLTILLSDFGCTGAGCAGDVDGDGDTDLDDLTVLLSQFGSVCQ